MPEETKTQKKDLNCSFWGIEYNGCGRGSSCWQNGSTSSFKMVLLTCQDLLNSVWEKWGEYGEINRPFLTGTLGWWAQTAMEGKRLYVYYQQTSFKTSLRIGLQSQTQFLFPCSTQFLFPGSTRQFFFFFFLTHTKQQQQKNQQTTLVFLGGFLQKDCLSN